MTSSNDMGDYMTMFQHQTIFDQVVEMARSKHGGIKGILEAAVNIVQFPGKNFENGNYGKSAEELLQRIARAGFSQPVTFAGRGVYLSGTVTAEIADDILEIVKKGSRLLTKALRKKGMPERYAVKNPAFDNEN